MHVAYIGLGSNLGDRAGNIRAALGKMREKGIEVTAVAEFIQTPPYGKHDQPDFINTVCQVRTALMPRGLLAQLQAIESLLGRVRAERWGPRTIDLDILLYDDAVLREDDLIIPHPDMLNRRFVLTPLSAIAPDARHPVSKRTIRQELDLLE